MTEQSQDQVLDQVEEQSQDQVPEEESGEGNNPSKVEVNGELIDIDELKKGYMRQSDYTRKTQQLSQAKSKSLDELKESNPDLYEQVVQPLREAGLATKEEMMLAFHEEVAKLDEKKNADKTAKQFFENNPDLEKSQKAILELSKNTGMTPEEVAIHYWFADSDKLQKGKKEVKGKFAPKPKSYSELSRQEKDAYINQTANIPDNPFYRR